MSLARSARSILLAGLVWLGAATVSWAALLLADSWWIGGEPLELDAVRQALELSLLASLAGVPLLLAGQALLRRVARADARGQLLGLAALLVAGAVPGLQQAAFLTAGDSISASPWVKEIQAAFTLAIALAIGGLALWHLRMTAERPVGAAMPLAALWKVPRAAAGLLGAAGAALLFYVLAFQLQFYEYLGVFLAVPLWTLISTLLVTTVGLRKLSCAVAGGVVLAASLALALPPPDEGEAAFGNRFAAYTRLLLGLRHGSDDLKLDVSEPALFQCAPRSTTRLARPAQGGEVQNVILISVDALRADALEWEVDGKAVAPRLRDFAKAGVWYENAQTTYPATVFSLGGALTGLSPSRILLAPQPPAGLFQKTKEVFDRQHISLPASTWFKKPIIDELLLQGTKARRFKDAKKQTHDAIKRLKAARKAKGRTLSWVHYFEPHAPYREHQDHSFGAARRERYLSEVAYLDEQVGALIDYLKEDGWLDDSLVIFFSDHGQALGERKYYGHHVYLDGFITNIALLMHAPGLPPRRATEMVAITDVAPTVLHAMDLPVPPELDGRSLLAPPEPGRRVVAEAFPLRGNALFQMANDFVDGTEDLRARVEEAQRWTKKYQPKVSVVDEQWRLIAGRDTGETELFRRGAKGDEQVRDAPDVRAALIEELAAWHRRTSELAYCRVRERAR